MDGAQGVSWVADRTAGLDSSHINYLAHVLKASRRENAPAKAFSLRKCVKSKSPSIFVKKMRKNKKIEHFREKWPPLFVKISVPNAPARELEHPSVRTGAPCARKRLVDARRFRCRGYGVATVRLPRAWWSKTTKRARRCQSNARASQSRVTAVCLPDATVWRVKPGRGFPQAPRWRPRYRASGLQDGGSVR